MKEMSDKAKQAWKRGAELERRYGLGPGCPPTMCQAEMDEFDRNEKLMELIEYKLKAENQLKTDIDTYHI